MTALAAVPDRPDTSDLKTEAAALVRAAQSVAIVDDVTYQEAAVFGKAIMAYKKKTAAKFAPHKARALAALTGLREDEAGDLKPADEAEQIIKGKLLDWQREEKKRQDELTRKREITARKLEEDRRIEEALDLDESGDRAGAEDILRAPIEVPMVALPPSSAPKVSGVATTKRWTFDRDAPVNVAAVIKHIAGIPQDQPLAHPELAHILALDTKNVQQRITADRENFNVPGIHAFESTGISLGSK